MTALPRLQTLLARVRALHADHRAIARGMLSVMLFVAIGKLAGAAKEVVVAWRFGVGEVIDAYAFVFNLIMWPVSVWFSIITIVLIPLAARLQRGQAKEYAEFRAQLLGLAILLGVGLALLGWAALPLAIQSQAVGMSPATAELATTMTGPLLMIVPCWTVAHLLSALIMSRGRHINTLLEGVPALVILLALLAFRDGGAGALVWGTVAGIATQLACLLAIERGNGSLHWPRFTFRSAQWAWIRQGAVVTLVGQGAMSLTGVIDQFAAAQVGAGAISTLNYSNRLLALLLSLGSLAVGRAMLPVLSESEARGDGGTGGIARRWWEAMFLGGVLATAIAIALAPWAVEVLFQRGEFTSRDTQAVVEVLTFGLFQLPFSFANLVLVSLFASTGRYRAIAAISCANLLVKLALVVALVPPLGLNGIPLSTSLMYLASFTMLVIAWRSRAT